MLVCSKAISEITNSAVKSFSIAMSTQTRKTKKKKKITMLFSSYMIYVSCVQMTRHQ